MKRSDAQTSFERAIRGSRKARSIEQRRRRRGAALLALLAITLTGTGLWTIGALTGNDMVKAAVTKAQSYAELIALRSPGARSAGELVNSKNARALARHRLASKPRHLRSTAVPKTRFEDIEAVVDAAAPFAPGAGLDQAFPVPELPIALPTMASAMIPGSGPASSPGGSTPASTPSTTARSEPLSPVLVPSAVPEPRTWATMLLGFVLMGWRIRRAKAAAEAAIA